MLTTGVFFPKHPHHLLAESIQMSWALPLSSSILIALLQPPLLPLLLMVLRMVLRKVLIGVIMGFFPLLPLSCVPIRPLSCWKEMVA